MFNVWRGTGFKHKGMTGSAGWAGSCIAWKKSVADQRKSAEEEMGGEELFLQQVIEAWNV